MLRNLLYIYGLNLLIITNITANFGQLVKDFNQKVQNEKIKSEILFWMNQQIDKDIKDAQSSGHSFNINRDLDNWFNNSHELLVRYKIKNNKITVQTPTAKMSEVAVIDRLARMNNILTVLSKLVKIPDVDIIVSLEDCINANGAQIPGIIFGAAKNKDLDKNVILMPDFQILDIYTHMLPQVEEGNLKYPWEAKKDQGLWIGATTGGFYNKENNKNFWYTKENYQAISRIKIVDLSFKFPDLLYARLNILTQMDDELKSILKGHLGEHMPLKEHMQYKYQISLDGNGTSSSRTYWQLSSNCVLLKQNSHSIRWFHNALAEYKHYIPVKNDLSNLIAQIKWAKKHDAQVKQISRNANDFAANNLQLADNLYYLYCLLRKVSKLQNVAN